MIQVAQNLIISFEFYWAFSNKCFFICRIPLRQYAEMLNGWGFFSHNCHQLCLFHWGAGHRAPHTAFLEMDPSLSVLFFNHSPPPTLDALGFPLMSKENLLQVLSSCLQDMFLTQVALLCFSCFTRSLTLHSLQSFQTYASVKGQLLPEIYTGK